VTVTHKPELIRPEYEKRIAVHSDIRDHMPFMYETAKGYDQPSIAELGTRSGNSTAAFLLAASEKGGRVLSVDLEPAQVPEAWLDCLYWTFIMSDDLSPVLLKDAALTGPYDVLFIDTSHAYMHTIRELEAWVPMMSPGGTVLLHDTEYQPTALEVGGVPQPRWPVMVAMKEYCAERRLSWENHTGCNGLGIIHIPGG
jgi:predicted O-methyltransferase YrrM